MCALHIASVEIKYGLILGIRAPTRGDSLRVASVFDHFDGFMDGRMIRDAVHPEELEQSEAEDRPEHRLLGTVAGLASDEPVEGCFPANHTINQLLAQMTVYEGEFSRGQISLEKVFNKVPTGAVLQDACRNFSWFFGLQHLK